MVGKTISHYRIISQLGAGGMGVVYAAEDPRLNRKVALKFVPDEVAHEAGSLDRLRMEARAASAINHPNICTIYDIGEYEGRPFIVMELLKGQTLRERISERPLKVHEAITIGIQVADALFWAHGQDIIHRDIKPANLFLTDQEQVKVLDFGLAKVVAAHHDSATGAPTADLTAAGMAVGTVAYMSPEQVSADTLDRRTDLFSLGVVLYECVTGQQPFQGKTSAVIMAAILTQQPPPPTIINGSIPANLQDVIQKCLEKDRELRYQDAAGLRADLKRVRRDIESGASRRRELITLAGAADSAHESTTGMLPSAAERPASGASAASVPVPRPKPIGLAVAGIAVAAIILVSAGLFVWLRPPQPRGEAQSIEAGAADSQTPPLSATPPPPDAADSAAGAAARPASPQFDAAIVEANRRLAAGDAEGATRALNTARALDPASPAVAEASARLVELFRAQATRRPANEPPRTQSPPPAAPTVAAAPAAAAPPAARASEPPAAAQPPVAAPPAVRPPPDTSTAVAPLPGQTAPQRPPDTRPAAPPPPPAAQASAPAEDDDVIIRRVVATYARAIETKDLGLYRSVKPNLSAAEQKTIQDGFRAVTSQSVTINIQSIEHRGQEAVVRLRRHDVIQAGGRQQTADSQQTLTLVRAATGWVIRDIGR